MREFQEKRKLRRALYSKTSLVFLIILIGFMSKATWNVYVKAQESRHNSESAQKEYNSLKARHDFLKAEIENLNTTEGKEKEIRQNFQVSKNGEKIVVIVEATSTVNTQAEEQTGLKKAWGSFWGIFGKKKP